MEVCSERQGQYRLRTADDEQALKDLLVGQLGVAHDGAARLDGLYDLGGRVARQREPRRVAVYLHRPPQRLLSSRCHAASTWQRINLTLCSIVG